MYFWIDQCASGSINVCLWIKIKEYDILLVGSRSQEYAYFVTLYPHMCLRFEVIIVFHTAFTLQYKNKLPFTLKERKCILMNDM